MLGNVQACRALPREPRLSVCNSAGSPGPPRNEPLTSVSSVSIAHTRTGIAEGSAQSTLTESDTSPATLSTGEGEYYVRAKCLTDTPEEVRMWARIAVYVLMRAPARSDALGPCFHPCACRSLGLTVSGLRGI